MGTFVEAPPPPVPAARAIAPALPRRRRLAAAAVPYLYLLPAAIGLVVFTYWPLAETFRLSFLDWNLLPTTPAEPAGTGNYEEALRLPEVGKAAWNTVLYTLGMLPFAVILPVVVALLTQRVGGRSRTFYRLAIFAPFLMAPVAAAIVWRWLLAPEGGLVNEALGVVGLGAVNWLRDPDIALVAITVIAGWKLLGFSVLVVSAAMTNISGDYAAAASVDGASPGQIARRVTLPLLSPTLLFMTLLTVLIAAQWVFPLIDTLTRGGPAESTTNLYYLLYQYGFRNFDVGLASAAGVLFFLAFGVIAVAGMWLMDRFSFHDA